MDKDEFDGDIMLAGISIPRELVKQFKEETTLWIRLRSFASSPNMTASFEDSNSIKPFSEDMQIQNPDETVEPIICIKVTYYGTECLKEYKVEISEFESAVKNSELFTQYTLTITRRDGYDWKIKFRYSQLDNIRKSLILQFPELKKLCFPKKTYFNFINLLKNQFNDEMIRKRKDEMEKFLNYVIKCRYHERNQEFNDFLHMHQGNE